MSCLLFQQIRMMLECQLLLQFQLQDIGVLHLIVIFVDQNLMRLIQHQHLENAVALVCLRPSMTSNKS